MNLKRVEELTGKFLHFYNEDIMDMAALQNIFKRVILFLFSSFFFFFFHSIACHEQYFFLAELLCHLPVELETLH